MKAAKVIVRYRNGQVIKGFSQDFLPNKDRFHLFRVDKPSEEAIEVLMKELKAVFFARDFKGNPKYKEQKKYGKGEKPAGRIVEVRFKDGEVLVGSTLGYDSKRQGFFLFPADPQSNNVRVYVLCDAIENIRFLKMTEAGMGLPVFNQVPLRTL